MEVWFVVVLTLCTSAILKSFLSLLFSPSKTLPPGPFTFPIIGNVFWLRKSFFDLEPILRDFKLKYGPIVTLKIGSRPAIFISSHSIAHQALVQNGAIFSDRPEELPTSRIISSNQHNISSAAYGPNWRLFRRNLTSEILHPSRFRSYSAARSWVLGILIRRLSSESESQEFYGIKVLDHIQYAMFCLLVFMCIGEKLEDEKIKQIEKVQRNILLGSVRYNILNFWPKLGKIVFRKQWKELIQVREDQDNVLIPLIKARLDKIKQREQHDDDDNDDDGEYSVAYVDTLAKLQLPEENNRNLSEEEMVSLCGEFLNAGTDTTSTALQWIMANLVKYPKIQAKLSEEIITVMEPKRPSLAFSGEGHEEKKVVVVEEEDLQRMPYLKAVVLESLRRHPPGHFVLPHSVTEEMQLDGYVVPKNAAINFMVAEMGWDPKVWNDPMEFKPERFLDVNNGEEGFDISGSREIKMMPFGSGRRICPGLGLAMLHLEYFVANLVWYFAWKAAAGGGGGGGGDVDLSEKQEFTVGMKHPLIAHISPRVR